MLFYISIAVSLYCILKTKRTHQWNRWDTLFLLSSWEAFNFKVWQHTLAPVTGYGYEVAALLCLGLSAWYAKRRGIDIGYTMPAGELGRIMRWLALLAVIIIPLGLWLGFITGNTKPDWSAAIPTIAEYILFVGTIEEIVFRGIIFNLLRRSMKTWLALLITTILFATIATHIAGYGTFPNWRYVGMAFVAGLAYGLVYL
ncbi:CPBP family intramembrane metalloprotease, partial [Patescibacteria group bacterium]|nr:CPBP family intramembrane metalloprotease [Patescibacteria group bacterium]